VFFRAKLAQFYGWTHHYIEELDYGTALEYYEAITVIESRDRMVDMNIVDYPHLKNDARRNMHREFKKLANPKELQREMSFEEFAKRMGIDGKRNNN